MTEPNDNVGPWQRAVVSATARIASNGVSLRLQLPQRRRHVPGQHYVIRLRAQDGYTAQRSYSLASAPSDPQVEFFIERLSDGEVSTYLCDVVQPGDELDVRGPVGGWFVWNGDGPAVGIAGGSGVVPLIAMLRHAIDVHHSDLLTLAVSAKTLAELPYADELFAAKALIRTTRQELDGHTGRLVAADLLPLLRPEARYLVCGSSTFSTAMSMLLIDLGIGSDAIRVESFGATT